MLDRLDTTIVAVSSAPGYGAVGIVRLSGPAAIDITDRLGLIEGGRSLRAHRASARVGGEVEVDDACTVPAWFYIFRAPRSYTRQDLVEVQAVGSPAVLGMIRNRAVDLGAVHAEPGEFTARAFLNGAMNLAHAEAVAAIIRAQTDTQLRASRRMIEERPFVAMTQQRDALAELLALVEAEIDFAEEPIEFIAPDALRGRLVEICDRLCAWTAGSRVIERLDVLPQILLFGAPNAGKSTLMNRLVGINRAICAAAAGTTRDILSAPVRLEHGEAILLDTAGIDRSDDEIIAEARARTLTEAARVDLVCVVMDLSRPDAMGSIADSVRRLDVHRIVVAANKSDLIPPGHVRRRMEDLRTRRLGPVHAISALTGEGVDVLRESMQSALGELETTALRDVELLSQRQREAVAEAIQAIRRAGELIVSAEETHNCADLLAVELREALDALGSLTGEVTTEDLLGQVFSNFCIGK